MVSCYCGLAVVYGNDQHKVASYGRLFPYTIIEITYMNHTYYQHLERCGVIIGVLVELTVSGLVAVNV
jgi:hypothetical protein